MRSFVLIALAIAGLVGCSDGSGLTSKPIGAAGDPAVVGPGPSEEQGGGLGEGEGEPVPGADGAPAGEAAPDRDPDPAPDPDPDPGPDPGGAGEPGCAQREREDAPACGDPCAAGCDPGTTCLTFPVGKLCLSIGEREDGQTCTSPGDCAGGLCVWSGGGPAHCTKECPGVSAGGDAVCGNGRSCLPSTTPAGSFHCYATGDLPIGDPCLRREGECEGGYCLGAGQAAYCTAWCDPADPIACPAGWTCRAYGEAHLCCDPQRTDGGC